MTARPDRRRAIPGNTAVVLALAGAALLWLAVQEGLQRPDIGAGRWAAAAAVAIAYAVLCGAAVRRARRAVRAPAPSDADDAERTVLVVFATQTGFAEELAGQAVQAMTAAGQPATACPLSRLDAATLATTRVALFVVATYGDGEPPDSARRFADRDMRVPLPSTLDRLEYGLLALGDRGYPRFCGFARDVEAWLDASGGKALFPRIDVDNGDAVALRNWQQRLEPWTGGPGRQALALPVFSPWRLVARQRSNPGSIGDPAFRIALAPVGPCPDWQAGDIAIVRLADGTPREYSIASLPFDGRIELLVRQALRPDGEPGRGAHWLTSQLAVGATTELRIRTNRGFRLEGVAASTPLVLIGNGTGLAGLRAHLKARAAVGATRNWLVFGERNAACDRHYGDELDAWQRDGTLERVDHAWSRDGERRTHVQDRLLALSGDVARWIDAGAVLLVCGSATGMAEGVDAALRAIVGDAVVGDLAAAGRYRRDVY